MYKPKTEFTIGQEVNFRCSVCKKPCGLMPSSVFRARSRSKVAFIRGKTVSGFRVNYEGGNADNVSSKCIIPFGILGANDVQTDL